MGEVDQEVGGEEGGREEEDRGGGADALGGGIKTKLEGVKREIGRLHYRD